MPVGSGPVQSLTAMDFFANLQAHDALVSFAALLVSTFLLWIVSVRKSNVTVVDTFWGLGFVLQAFVHTLLPENLWLDPVLHWKQLFVFALVAAWGFRLAIYLHIRNHDVRYAAIRKRNSPGFEWKSLFIVFWLQAVLNWIIGQSIRSAVIAKPSNNSFSIFELISFSVYFTGIFFEVIGDLELYVFKSDPKNKGKLMTSGLRKYTRHPNYFGDAVVFWSYYLFSASAGDYTTLYAPILMTFLLLKVSGVALLERGMRKSKPGWDDYVAATPAFFPWFPKAVTSKKNN